MAPNIEKWAEYAHFSDVVIAVAALETLAIKHWTIKPIEPGGDGPQMHYRLTWRIWTD